MIRCYPNNNPHEYQIIEHTECVENCKTKIIMFCKNCGNVNISKFDNLTNKFKIFNSNNTEQDKIG